MILTLKFWRVFGVIAYIWRDLGLPPLIFEKSLSISFSEKCGHSRQN